MTKLDEFLDIRDSFDDIRNLGTLNDNVSGIRFWFDIYSSVSIFSENSSQELVDFSEEKTIFDELRNKKKVR